jgi:hypothetical protein
MEGQMTACRIEVTCPDGFREEKNYVLNLLSDFTGIGFNVSYQAFDRYEFILPNGKKIVFGDIFFGSVKDNNYLKSENLPEKTRRLNCAYGSDLPVIYGDGGFFEDDGVIRFGLDFIASIFFMTGRWEESVIKERDDHGRFPGGLSLAVKEGFIGRPVVDEYISLFTDIVKKLDNSVSFAEHSPEVIITCDVDSFARFGSGKTLKLLAGHLLKRFDPLLFVSDVFKMAGKFFGAKDPYDKFDRIFSIASGLGTKPVFFILTQPEGPYNDGWFVRTDRDVRIFGELNKKGAQIGLHYGYFSLLHKKNIIQEKCALEKKYSITVEKGRAHFLQFDIAGSFDILELSGIKEDFTLGYSRYAGFRCGTGRAFRPWDIDRRQAYNIIERPLIVMDTSLYAHNKLNRSQIRAEFEHFINISKKFRTDLTILIHNSSPDYVFEAVEKSLNVKQK